MFQEQQSGFSSVIKYDLEYGQGFPLQPPHGLQTSTCLHHSK